MAFRQEMKHQCVKFDFQSQHSRMRRVNDHTEVNKVCFEKPNILSGSDQILALRGAEIE